MKQSIWKATHLWSPPGIRGQVVSLHDGFHFDLVEGDQISPRALVEFDNRFRFLVDRGMK